MDRTIALIQKSHDGDEEARAQLVEENAGLVWCIVKRFMNRGVEAEDLFQIGSIGLLKAIDKFDLTYNVKFSTYAVPMISGEIKRFLRDDGMIKVSRSLKELAYKAYLCQERLQESLGREPLLSEIAQELSVSIEELTMAMEASGDIESLQKSIYQKDGQEIRLMDKLPGQERQEDKILDHMVLGNLLMSLEQTERQLIYLRYFANRTQTQVGEELGISQVQVSRMEKKILKQMREKI
ncbi:MAG: RNA polymerase sporulation sigma factor, SigF/SigG family [Dorea sp.]|jgi:RNA polymerase sigma factor, sigma-70 family/RNA polymerase sigma-70 factor, sigma-B/F/G subfamily|nr:RNA polymerase sporulation sigma factor, SigF/SigG family [Dorea sp.]